MARKTKMNSLTSPELLEQVNPDNLRLLDDFVEYCKSTQKSPDTIKGYVSDIRIACVWALQHNNNLFFVEWTRKQIIRLQNWLLYTNENSPARVRRIKASLSSMSNYIENIEEDTYPEFRNIINKIESPKNNPVREKTVFEREELEGLLKHLVDNKQYMKACFLALAMYGGRRKAELCRFRVSDFANDKDHIVCDGALYQSDPIKTKGRSGGKMLVCYTLVKPFKPYLDMWLAERERLGIQSEWLFPHPSDPTQHIGISMANSWASSFSKMLGKDLYWHALRHFAVSEMSRQGLPDNAIIMMLGWSKESGSAMFSIYNDRPQEDQLSEWFKDGEINTSGRKSVNDI